MLRALLSPAQRSQFFTIPADIVEQDLVRRYTFSPADLSLISSHREAHNRIGFAVQLYYLRFPGRPLQAGEQVPYSLLSYVAMQLNLSAESFQLRSHPDTKHLSRSLVAESMKGRFRTIGLKAYSVASGLISML